MVLILQQQPIACLEYSTPCKTHTISAGFCLLAGFFKMASYMHVTQNPLLSPTDFPVIFQNCSMLNKAGRPLAVSLSLMRCSH